MPHSSVLKHSPGSAGPQWNLPSGPFGRCSERLSGWPERAQQSRSRGDFLGGLVAKTPGSQSRALGLIPGQGTRCHMLRLRVQMPQPEISHAATKIEDPVYPN